MRIYTVGIGSAAGTTIEVEGFKVHSQLDEPMLRADRRHHRRRLLRGRRTRTSSRAIYDGIDTRLVIRPEAMEVTSLFAGAGVLVLLVGGIASLLWLGRLP